MRLNLCVFSVSGCRRLLREESPGCEGVGGLPHRHDAIPDKTVPGDARPELIGPEIPEILSKLSMGSKTTSVNHSTVRHVLHF